MFERVYFIIKIRKMHSKSIILHENVEVKFKIAGNTLEIPFSVGVNKKSPIQNVSKDNILIKKLAK